MTTPDQDAALCERAAKHLYYIEPDLRALAVKLRGMGEQDCPVRDVVAKDGWNKRAILCACDDCTTHPAPAADGLHPECDDPECICHGMRESVPAPAAGRTALGEGVKGPYRCPKCKREVIGGSGNHTCPSEKEHGDE